MSFVKDKNPFITHPSMQITSLLTSVARLAVDALFRDAANGPVPVHKEAVAERVTEPLHGWRHAAAG